jgi:hypothetical protein
MKRELNLWPLLILPMAVFGWFVVWVMVQILYWIATS